MSLAVVTARGENLARFTEQDDRAASLEVAGDTRRRASLTAVASHRLAAGQRG